MINIVGSRELVVTISDKFVKTGDLFWGESDGSPVKVVESCKGVNKESRRKRKRKVAHWNRRTGERAAFQKKTVTMRDS